MDVVYTFGNLDKWESYNLMAVIKITSIIPRKVFVQIWYPDHMQQKFLEGSLQM